MKIKLGELRVGNIMEQGKIQYFEYDGFQRYAIVLSKTEPGVIDRYSLLTELKPIKCDGDMLVEYGFRKYVSDTSVYYNFDSIELDWYHDKSNGRSGWVLWGHEDDMRTLNYLHQIQNLIWDLTGKELI